MAVRRKLRLALAAVGTVGIVFAGACDTEPATEPSDDPQGPAEQAPGEDVPVEGEENPDDDGE